MSASRLAIVLGFVAAGVACNAVGQERNLYWGDLHLHTNYSLDAYGVGNTYLTPDDAYRFARGIPVYHRALDAKVQIDRPLDFLAVTDHSDSLGIDALASSSDPVLGQTEAGRAILDFVKEKPWAGIQGFARANPSLNVMQNLATPQVRGSTWQKEVDAAEKNNIPGTFTTLFGWEWTAMISGKNLHRNVITNANGRQASQFVPYAAGQFYSVQGVDSNRPEDLWAWLDATAKRLSIDFIAIPHNANISGGLMFDVVDSDGRPLDAQYARTRARWESLVEVTQMKGTSEIAPELAPNDEFADYEVRRKLLVGTAVTPTEADYARTGLMRGLAFQNSLGANPFKFGLIGATDGHIGMSSVEERDFSGKIASDSKLSQHAPVPGQRAVIFPAWEMSASGLTAVWADENTRDSIFAAMKRKEVYATTGTRISLRMFGGFSFAAADARAADLAAVGYRKGVPMGSDLSAAPKGKAPSFLILAVKDPAGANLDRIQVVKGWLDDQKQPQQKVYDVAWSGNRKVGADGKLPAVGNTVDISTAMYKNTIGAAQLAAVWTDPDFKASQEAFYYVRALEIPTPRHSLYDAVALGIDVSVTRQPATIQERAYSSPIWYTP